MQAFVDLADEVGPGHGQLWQDIQLFVALLGEWDRDVDGVCELESMATRIKGVPAYFYPEDEDAQLCSGGVVRNGALRRRRGAVREVCLSGGLAATSPSGHSGHVPTQLLRDKLHTIRACVAWVDVSPDLSAWNGGYPWFAPTSH